MIVNVYMDVLLEKKSEAASMFKVFMANVNGDGKVEVVRSDNGGEFISGEFRNMCVENYIM